MKFVGRSIESSIKKTLFKGRVILIFGARRVGKTSLIKKIGQSITEKPVEYHNAELLSVREALSVPDIPNLRNFLGKDKVILLDEAQSIPGIGLILKICTDHLPDIQIIATGSSAFELASKVSEPLTGRASRYLLYPLSFKEIAAELNPIEFQSQLENRLRFGSYPEIVGLASEEEITMKLEEITSNYLYKDVLNYAGIHNSEKILKLLKLLALQLGQEVSIRELGRQLEMTSETVNHYIDVLEKSFVIFHLSAFSRNLRKELSTSIKIYFYDLGIRNSLIRNHNPLDIRTDIGALWGNTMIVEKMKSNGSENILANYYFWRTYDQQEIDLIEEKNGRLRAYEFKWTKGKGKIPKLFLETYKNSTFEVVNKGNFRGFLGMDS